MSIMEDNLVANYEEKLSTITIDVYTNCQLHKVAADKKGSATYQSVVGALEIYKNTIMISQSADNMETFIKAQKEMKEIVKKDKPTTNE